MNYWLMNLHPTDERRTDAEIRSYVSSRVIGMGRNFSPSQEGDFKNAMQIGDVVLVLNGRTPMALVEVIGDWYEFDDDHNSIIWYPLRRSVKILCMSNIEGNDCFSNLPMIPKHRTSTLSISLTQTCPTYQYIKTLHNCCTGSAQVT